MNVKKGDKATIVNGIFGHNVGKVVEVGELKGDHSKFGPIWHVRSLGPDLITEFGATGKECDCADAWLRKNVDTTPPQKMVDEEELLAA